MAYPRYSGDPHWIVARYPGTCADCGAEIKKGSRAFRFKDGSLFGDSCGCGRRESQKFDCAAEDEAFMTRQFF